MLRTVVSETSAPKEKSGQIKVCIRGLAGLLGSRIAQCIARNPDLKLTAGIVKKDWTLQNVFATMDTCSEGVVKGLCPEALYLDEKHSVVREVNKAQTHLKFEPADQLNLGSSCDLVVDVSAPGTLNSWWNKYCELGKPVILQSGEYPKGRLISLPLVEAENGKDRNIYRQGDCILSGISPVLAHLKPVMKNLTMHVVTQYTDKLGDYPTDLRLSAAYYREDVQKQIEGGLKELLDCSFMIMGVVQIPGISYYTISLSVETKESITGLQLRDMLIDRPRIRIVPGLNSTFEIEQFHKERVHAIGRELPPISVFGADLNSDEKKKTFRIGIALDYKPLVALANIDAIRAIGLGLSGEEAMRITDGNMGFIT